MNKADLLALVAAALAVEPAKDGNYLEISVPIINCPSNDLLEDLMTGGPGTPTAPMRLALESHRRHPLPPKSLGGVGRRGSKWGHQRRPRNATRASHKTRQ